MPTTQRDFNKEAATKYLDSLLKSHRIKVSAWSVTSCGTAWKKLRKIKIPKPTNIDRFAVCLHEVFHIIGRKGSKSYEKEFYCDMYARQTLIDFGYDTTAWDMRTKWHVLSRVAMAHNRGLNLDKLNEDVKAFFPEIDFSKWVGNKVFVGHKYAKSNNPNDIQFTPTDVWRVNKEDIIIQLSKLGLSLRKSDIDDSTYGYYIVHPVGGFYGSEHQDLREVVKHYQLTPTL